MLWLAASLSERKPEFKFLLLYCYLWKKKKSLKYKSYPTEPLRLLDGAQHHLLDIPAAVSGPNCIGAYFLPIQVLRATHGRELREAGATKESKDGIEGRGKKKLKNEFRG